MAKQRFSAIDRVAFWEAHQKVCVYCGVPLLFRQVEIDHIIPESLIDRPDELSELLQSLGLPADFDVYGDLNLVPSCGPCNRKKTDRRFQPLHLLMVGLAEEKASLIRSLRDRYTQRVTTDKILAQFAAALDNGSMTLDDVRDALGESVNASPIVVDLLAGGVPTEARDLNSILRIFGNASQALLGWPQETAGHWIDRPELEQLREGLSRGPSCFIALLGEPGTGKSALMGKLGTQLHREGRALLAIKADLLPKEVSSLAELDEWLGVPAPLVDCVRELARTQPLVLLLDQVDALSELMDQHTARLTVLLTLVNRLRHTENIHILLSCRDFEFRHELRLSSLNPDTIRLADPSWEQAQAVLASLGASTSAWPDHARELLCRPQHLSLFVEHFAGGDWPVFDTYQAMLEAVVQRRVLRPFGSAVMEAAEAIAAGMAEDEELWLPVARFERMYRDELDKLVAASFLCYSRDGRRVGFRHQTLFDFVRARAFAARVLSLADYVLARQDAVFVRPTLWSALQYLRTCDHSSYIRELGQLWAQENLRLHLRLLLISFLGQLPDPDPQEGNWLLPCLRDLTLRRRVLMAMEGSRGWFEKLKPYLPALMTTDNESAWETSWILRRALEFDRDTALAAIERYWLPDTDRDEVVFGTLRDLKDWDERTVNAIQLVAGRNPIRGSFLAHAVGLISASTPALAPRVLAASLWCELRRAQAEPVEVPTLPPDASESQRIVHDLVHHDASYRAIKHFISDSSEWHELDKVAAASPSEFLDQVWPWMIHTASAYAHETKDRLERYREDPIFELSGDYEFLHRFQLSRVIEGAVVGFAQKDADGFLELVRQQEQRDLLVVHRYLAVGLERLAHQRPDNVVRYVLADRRRFAIGPHSDIHRESRRLIAAAAPHLDRQSCKRLEEAIIAWHYYRDLSSGERSERRDRRKWDREHRLRLLRSFPRDLLSEAGRKLYDEEERALPKTRNEDVQMGAGFEAVRSPVAAERMEKASDSEIVKLFEELHDGTGWDHPKHWLKGGSIQASREFADLTKRDPERAFRLFEYFKPGLQERPAAEALKALGNSQKVEPRVLVTVIHRLSSRGFGSEEFCQDAAWCLAEVASRSEGLDDETCTLLESWLTDAEDHEVAPELSADETRPRSVLLGQGTVILPHGNYPILHALFLGFLNRRPMAADRWLTVLERHLDRREQLKVWEALAFRELPCLVNTERHCAAKFLARLFERYPAVLDSEAGVHLVGGTHSWLPHSLTQKCVEHWQGSKWKYGPQAAGEIAMLRHALVPDDDFCTTLVETALSGPECAREHLAAVRLGIAYMAVELWDNPKARGVASAVVLRLGPLADDQLSEVLLDVFRSTEHMPLDEHTEQLLDMISDHPHLLKNAHAGFLVDRLKDIVQQGAQPERVCRVATAVLDQSGTAIADMRTGWAASAGQWIDIALTLQRLPQTRSSGLNLFERLMILNVHSMQKVLTELDRHLPG